MPRTRNEALVAKARALASAGKTQAEASLIRREPSRSFTVPALG